MEENQKKMEDELFDKSNEHNYIALDIVQNQHQLYEQISHLSKLYFYIILVSSIASAVLGIWLMTIYFRNDNIPWLEYRSTWEMIILLLIPFILIIFIAFWFWKQFDKYNKSLAEYIKIPTLESATIMYQHRSRFWYIVYLIYLVCFISFIIGLFSPSVEMSSEINLN